MESGFVTRLISQNAGPCSCCDGCKEDDEVGAEDDEEDEKGSDEDEDGCGGAKAIGFRVRMTEAGDDDEDVIV